MSEIKYTGMIPITIFDDDHELHQHEDYLKVICPKIDEIFNVSSNKGTLNIHCPGCGVQLYEK